MNFFKVAESVKVGSFLLSQNKQVFLARGALVAAAWDERPVELWVLTAEREPLRGAEDRGAGAGAAGLADVTVLLIVVLVAMWEIILDLASMGKD